VAKLAAQLGELLGAYLPGRGTADALCYSLSARRYTLSGGRGTADALSACRLLADLPSASVGQACFVTTWFGFQHL
ncbi:hypothetical protein BHM03_00024386, partial [Ensete ventricosum]